MASLYTRLEFESLPFTKAESHTAQGKNEQKISCQPKVETSLDSEKVLSQCFFAKVTYYSACKNTFVNVIQFCALYECTGCILARHPPYFMVHNNMYNAKL